MNECHLLVKMNYLNFSLINLISSKSENKNSNYYNETYINIFIFNQNFHEKFLKKLISIQLHENRF